MKRLVSDIAIHMRQKSTKELLSIWDSNNREEWSEEAFDAVEVVLNERGVPFSERKNHENDLPLEKPQSEASLQFLYMIVTGIKWGAGFVMVIVILGFRHGHGAIASIFSRDGIGAFICGFMIGAFVAFIRLDKRNE